MNALASIGATGYRTFPVDVVDHDGSRLGDFVGFAIEDDDPAKDLRFANGVQFWTSPPPAGSSRPSPTPASPDCPSHRRKDRAP
ncbi:hypothetical protein ACFWMR_08745 [Amycolatopsis thailandensis]|uniref:hypothetical protein n=1 Tax=Amycolatopsis thailandensis TaxID=589330 RepID=UPI003668F034